MCKGYVEESNKKMENYAWVVSNLMNVHLEKKSRVSVQDLLPSNDKAGNMKEALIRNSSSNYHKEQDVMKLLEANSGKFNS